MSPRPASPSWWPEGEPWPPAGWGRPGHGSGPWRGRGHGPWRPVGCLVLLLGLFAAGSVVLAIWAAAAILGLVEAPPIVVAGGVVAFVVVAFGGLAVGLALRRMTQPLDALIEAARRIEAGDYTARVPEAGGGEMRSLMRAFNRMSAQLEAADVRRRAFLADVSHELRTPLTVMMGQLEAIEDGVYAADRERLAALLVHTRQMADLVEDLRTISLAEAGALDLEPRPTDLNVLADEVVTGYTAAAELAGISLRAEPASVERLVAADTAATRRVLGNLVSNSLRHTPRAGSITVAVHESDHGAASIEVADTGTGMPADLAAHTYERFKKGPDSEGSGLGLAIARELVEAQGGSIALRSEPGRGTSVRVTLPPVSG